MSPPSPYHTVLLVGFMGSGKSSVGRRLAARLGWDFLDFDELIEERSGLSVERIFREKGEAAFRRLEAEVAEEALRGRERVLASGGGWAAAPGRLAATGPGVLTVWLDVDPETAVRRARGDARVRPLLEVPDPVERAQELLARRRPYYEEADLRMDTAGVSPERLAEDIVRFLGRDGSTS